MTTNASFEEMVGELWDRLQIRQVVLRCARGMDRCERGLILSAFHPGATIDYGRAFKGSAEEMAAWANDMFTRQFERSGHVISNHFVEFDRRDRCTAYGETYVRGVLRSKSQYYSGLGRYLDRFEKRVEVWRIAERTVVLDIVQVDTGSASTDADLSTMTEAPRDPLADPSYGWFPAQRSPLPPDA